jgi:hypothetical protein
MKSRAALQLENVALRHQIGVLQRSARKTAADEQRTYNRPTPAQLSRLRRSVVFIIVTSARLPEEPLPGRRSGLLGFACLLDLRATLALTSTQRHRRPRR